MEQLLFALLMNAIQAADGQAERGVVVTGRACDQEIELHFEDNCGGIAVEINRDIYGVSGGAINYNGKVIGMPLAQFTITDEKTGKEKTYALGITTFQCQILYNSVK